MKKFLLTLAVLGTVAGSALAQSSVTLSGTIDVSGEYINNTGASRRFSLGNSGLNSGQLVFSGTEDLGSGLRAGFELNTSVLADNGTGGGSGTQFFNRRSVVYISGRLGEIRLGREYSPTFANLAIFDAFGTYGIGSSINTQVGRLYTGTRRDNAINYLLPKGLGGIYGQFTVAAGESGTNPTLDRAGRYIGGRVGYATGPLNIAIAASDQRFDNLTGPGSVAQCGLNNQRTYNLGTGYDLGFVKLMGYYDYEKCGRAQAQVGSVSAVVPFGQSEVHLGYDYDHYRDRTLQQSNVDQIKATYVYNLSKRTAMYTTFSYLDNKSNRSRVAIPGGNPIDAGGSSKGGEFGIRHFF